jgi:hypothetical protein
MLHLIARKLGRTPTKSKSTQPNRPDRSAPRIPSEPSLSKSIPQTPTPSLLSEPSFQASTPTPPLSLSDFPHELLEIIFILSISDGGYTATSLRLVCRNFSEIVRPYLFRYICVSGESRLRSLSRALSKASVQQLKHIRHVFLSDRIREEADVSWHPAHSPDQESLPVVRDQKNFTAEAERLVPSFEMILNRIAPYVRTLRLLLFNTRIYSRLRSNGVTSLVYIRLTSFSILRTYKRYEGVLFHEMPALRDFHIRLHPQSVPLPGFLNAATCAGKTPLLESLKVEGVHPVQQEVTFAAQARRFVEKFPKVWAEWTPEPSRRSSADTIMKRLRVNVHTCDWPAADPHHRPAVERHPDSAEVPYEQIETWPAGMRIYAIQPLDDAYTAWKAAWLQQCSSC